MPSNSSIAQRHKSSPLSAHESSQLQPRNSLLPASDFCCLFNDPLSPANFPLVYPSGLPFPLLQRSSSIISLSCKWFSQLNHSLVILHSANFIPLQCMQLAHFQLGPDFPCHHSTSHNSSNPDPLFAVPFCLYSLPSGAPTATCHICWRLDLFYFPPWVHAFPVRSVQKFPFLKSKSVKTSATSCGFT